MRTPLETGTSALAWALHFALGLTGFAVALAIIWAFNHHWSLREGGHAMSVQGFVPHEPVRSWSAGQTVSVEFTDISLEAFAILTNIPLVDLSIDFEPWFVRGED